MSKSKTVKSRPSSHDLAATQAPIAQLIAEDLEEVGSEFIVNFVKWIMFPKGGFVCENVEEERTRGK